MPRNLLVSLIFLGILKLNRFNSLVCHLTCFLKLRCLLLPLNVYYYQGAKTKDR